MMVVLRGKAYYQFGHSAQYSGFKIATGSFVVFVLEFIFIATSHKHFAFINIIAIKFNLVYFIFFKKKRKY